MQSWACWLETRFSAQYNRGYFYLRQRETGLYFNDKWKLSPKLTVNFGLRWDQWTPFSEKSGRLAAIDDRTVLDKFEVVTPYDVQMEDLPDTQTGLVNLGLSANEPRTIQLSLRLDW